jgi:deoxyribonuclease IV
MSRIGLHLRVTDSLLAVAHQAVALELPHFQSFLMGRDAHDQLLIPSDREITQFRKVCEKRFSRLYAHAPFWLNLADPARSSLEGVWKQIQLAQRLGFTHLIMHPGSSVQASRQEGIAMVARTLNGLLKKQFDITLVLENTAFGNRAVGSDITDLAMIRALLDKPERVQFCIDTAHAHSYGYAINSADSMQQFLRSVHATLGIESVGLLHLNDTSEANGSFHDRHALIGTGMLGEASLRAAFQHPLCAQVPIIIEPPQMAPEELAELYKKMQAW